MSGSYNQPASVRKPRHTNTVQQAIYIWRSVADWEAIHDELNYKSHRDMPMTHPWRTNVMNNIAHVPLEEVDVSKEKPALKEDERSDRGRNLFNV